MLHALRHVVVSVLSGAVAIAAFARSPLAQCSNQFSPTGPQAELSGQGRCTTLWDPDGAGPEPQRLVVGGRDLIGGSEPILQRVMTWDGSRWQALGPGPGTSGEVLALAVWNGQLVAGGDFTGGGTDFIARWDGSAWQPIGPTTFTAPVNALTVWNGSLVAAETFPLGAGPVSGVFAWNGVAWSTVPWGIVGSVAAMVSYQGLLCMAGGFTLVPTGILQRWDGTTMLPSITADARITSLAVRPFPGLFGTDLLFAGGAFTSIGGTAAARVAVTSGGTSFAWSALGSGLASQCNELHVRTTSPLHYTLVALTASGVSQYQTGTGSWASLGIPQVASIDHYAGSYHAASSSVVAACLRYDAPNWVPVRGAGFDNEVRALAPIGDDMVVGGAFTSTPDGAMQRIARWDGTTFQALGGGMTGQVSGSTSVDSLLALQGGDVVAGGLFVDAGGVVANSIARWNGTSWSSLGSGVNQQVLALCEMPNGDIVAGGWFTMAGGMPCARIARWDGTSWMPLGSGMNGSVQALAVRSDGVLFAGGTFSTAGGAACSRIAQWNGVAWQPLGVGCSGDVFALAVRPNDDVVAVGSFTSAGGLPANRCARWLATGWATMGSVGSDPFPPHAVLALPNGDVVAGRGFHQPASPDSGIARWNGSTWSGIGSGLAAAYATTSVEVRALALRRDGSLIVGGDFSVAGGSVSRDLAALSSTCPAAASTFGAGCSSSVGPLALVAETLPWVGGTFRTATTGVAPLSLCLGVTGFAPVSVPLPSILAAGQPGCSLLVAPDILTLLQPNGGAWPSALPLAPDPSLIGATFFQQSIPFEFDAGGALVAIRGSNGLAATIGTL